MFISYASPDAAVANQVCPVCSHGARDWMAPRDVKPGAAYADAIVRAINEAGTLVLICLVLPWRQNMSAGEVERAAAKRQAGGGISGRCGPFKRGAQSTSCRGRGGSMCRRWALPAALIKLGEAVRQGSAAQADPGLGGGGAPADTSGEQAVGTSSVAKRVVVAAVGHLGTSRRCRHSCRSLLVVYDTEMLEAPAVSAISAISEKSIAVLPFTDMSEKKDQAVFCGRNRGRGSRSAGEGPGPPEVVGHRRRSNSGARTRILPASDPPLALPIYWRALCRKEAKTSPGYGSVGGGPNRFPTLVRTVSIPT